MTNEMQLAVVGAASALFGSLIGGIVSFITTNQSAKLNWRYTQRDKQIGSLLELYAAFLEETGRIALTSVEKQFSTVSDYAPLNTLLARIRLLASPDVLKAADKLGKGAIKMHALKNAKNEQDGINLYHEGFAEFCSESRKEISELKILA